MTKAALLRQLLETDTVVRAMGAHNGLSAKLVEEAGFEAIWASGLEISAAYGLPDTSILSMKEFLDIATQMAFVTNVPIIADCDTGFGDEHNVSHLVRHYERQGIAAICIEDKFFPKINSFMIGDQDLIPIESFTAKIRAAKATQRDPDFMVIARTEAFISGLGLEVALERANAYADAGADAILVHSKASTAIEIKRFMMHWTRSVPIVIVPTTYPDITLEEIQDLGIKVVIYANHGLRASIKAIRQAFSEIYREGHLRSVEGKLVSVQEVFALQGVGQPIYF